MPGGLWTNCPSCGEMMFTKDLVAHFLVCPKCSFHMTATVDDWIKFVADPRSFEELYTDLKPVDRLDFKDKISYGEKLAKTAEKAKRLEAVTIGTARVGGRDVVLGIMDFKFLGGSMGVVVGEKVTIAVEMALERGVPLIMICASGGARMHEGALSLMQMAKTCAALARLDQAGGLYISVLTNPTTGGVTASFATMADVILAEPGALIGFAGPRVIQNTIKQDLPEGFQRAEFLLDRGQIDSIVTRDKLKDTLFRCMQYLRPVDPAELQPVAAADLEAASSISSNGQEGKGRKDKESAKKAKKGERAARKEAERGEKGRPDAGEQDESDSAGEKRDKSKKKEK
ncbi:MAG: acetyl-CoA carboxylase carboxyltransferase subunit beta [Planctomycetes bacterium]|nr:acetyl-CoA carboxylase carboxyltransferase subunit beta [Planctomycetota bacterium]